MKRIAIIVSVLVVAFMSGCASSQRPNYTVSVNGLAAHTTKAATSFILLPGDKNVATTDLQFQEYAGFVERALGQRGLQRASSVDKADIMILLAYGVGDPKEHVYSYSIPNFGQTGVSSSSTYGSIYGNSYSGTTYYTPTYGITGFSSHVGTYVTFTRHVLIEAVDLPAYRSKKKVVQVWKTGIVSVGSSGDLRRVFPVMIGAASSYLGTNTGEIRTVSIYEDDPRVLVVKGVTVEPRK